MFCRVDFKSSCACVLNIKSLPSCVYSLPSKHSITTLFLWVNLLNKIPASKEAAVSLHYSFTDNFLSWEISTHVLNFFVFVNITATASNSCEYWDVVSQFTVSQFYLVFSLCVGREEWGHKEVWWQKGLEGRRSSINFTACFPLPYTNVAMQTPHIKQTHKKLRK